MSKLFLLLSFLCIGATVAGSNPLAAETKRDSINVPPVLLQMIRDSAIQAELNLSEDQIASLRETLVKVDGPWFRSRNLPSAEQRPIVDQLTQALASRLDTILDPSQASRLDQLVSQALGTRMVLREKVQASLQINEAQMQSLVETFAHTDARSLELQQAMAAGEKTADEVNKTLADLKAAERESLLEILTNIQRSKIGALTGKPFDFASIKRTFPLAPELRSDGAKWLDGTPVTLQQYRGKVVAVHFYAFQCINCKRNLPHYTAWHDDYADDGLVVIGIQTPELSSERNFDNVRAAAKAEGIEYPVMLDAESANWKSYNTTMWPTVYLIDKEGFVRRWWQGEMNWQGTPGEQQMRTTIEALLSE
ncbi:Redoxin domain-containing protein [Rhodopirellula maiorica SM1]|uniref:Redoxin domain-containing protein n=1 Tax=Rhodopirellula maiorica SM1 TaxID=1265738 RepID=M5R9W4_9BACT|nr:redoxin domain-containing protein [Rhodopirellula maiorica]EMI16175.1 Redoxin domain-containing protein [Rhodopirellula maiorica SM1]